MLTAPKMCCSNALLPGEVMNTQFISSDAAISVKAAAMRRVTADANLAQPMWRRSPFSTTR
jgi:hypothetical protein